MLTLMPVTSSKSLICLARAELGGVFSEMKFRVTPENCFQSKPLGASMRGRPSTQPGNGAASMLPATAGAVAVIGVVVVLSLIHISEPTRLGMISYAVFCL